MIEFSDNKPIYRQIVDHAYNLILDGRWEPGARVPSVREFPHEFQEHAFDSVLGCEGRCVAELSGRQQFACGGVCVHGRRILSGAQLDIQLAHTFGIYLPTAGRVVDTGGLRTVTRCAYGHVQDRRDVLISDYSLAI